MYLFVAFGALCVTGAAFVLPIAGQTELASLSEAMAPALNMVALPPPQNKTNATAKVAALALSVVTSLPPQNKTNASESQAAEGPAPDETIAPSVSPELSSLPPAVVAPPQDKTNAMENVTASGPISANATRKNYYAENGTRASDEYTDFYNQLVDLLESTDRAFEHAQNIYAPALPTAAPLVHVPLHNIYQVMTATSAAHKAKGPHVLLFSIVFITLLRL